MKKFLVFATVAAAITSSCTKQYIDEATNLNGSDAIGFSTYVANASKGVAKSDFVMGDQFFVYGGQTGAANFDITAPNNGTWTYTGANFPDNGAKVSNYGNNVWRYDNPQPWGDFKTTFFAFSPVPVVGGETHGITMTTPAVNTIPAIDFVVKGGYPTSEAISSPAANAARLENKKQVDLLWAFAADKSRVDRSVDLLFKHTLTQLNFSVRSLAPAGQMIRINTIAVKNVSTKATLALAHNDTLASNKLGALNYMGGWKAHAEVKNFPVNLKNSVAALIKDNEIHAINDADEALMMIPQDLTNIELEVCYSFSRDGIAWENYQSGTPVTVKLNTFTHTHWNPAHSIRYILNITPGAVIAFTANVEDWGTVGNIEFLSVSPSKNAGQIHELTLEAGDTFSAQTGGWITYDDGSGVKDLTTAPVTAAAGTYKFAVLANGRSAIREDQIIIKKADGRSQLIIKVAQSAGDGTFNVPTAAGEVTTLDLKSGDKIAVPQTKADATWVKYKVGAGAETAFAGEYTAAADEKFTLTVEANTGAERAAIVTVTPATGTAFAYTIKQAGIATENKNLDPKAIAGQVLTGVANDVIKVISGGGDWLTISEDGGADVVLADKTAGKAYAIKVTMNATTAARTAKFSVTSANKVITYTLTQAAATASAIAVAKDGTPAGTLTLNVGDKILKNVAASAWLTVDSPDGSTVGYDFASDVAITETTKGEWVLKAAANDSGSDMTETFTVVTAADGVVLYTVTQAAV